MRHLRQLALGLWLAAASGGCSLLAAPDEDELGPPPSACLPGTVRQCPCLPVGTPDGTQQCVPGGRYSVCRCPPVAGGGG